MANLKHLLLVFAVVQTAFITLDFYEVWREEGRRPFGRLLKTHWEPALFLAGVWGAYLVIQTLLMAAMPSLEATLSWFTSFLRLPEARPAAARAASLPWVIGSLLAATYLVCGFWDYLVHRFLLHTRVGWFLHENHHLPTQVFNGMPGISVRPFVAPATFVTYFLSMGTVLGAVKWMGQPGLILVYLPYLPAMVLSIALVGSASHSCFLRRFRGLHDLVRVLFITTPQEHILHHAARLNGNYGNFMTVWDRVFGTYLDPRRIDIDTVELGLPYDQDFLGTLTGGKWKIPRPLRVKYRLGAFCRLDKARPIRESSFGALTTGRGPGGSGPCGHTPRSLPVPPAGTDPPRLRGGPGRR